MFVITTLWFSVKTSSKNTAFSTSSVQSLNLFQLHSAACIPSNQLSNKAKSKDFKILIENYLSWSEICFKSVWKWCSLKMSVWTDILSYKSHKVLSLWTFGSYVLELFWLDYSQEMTVSWNIGRSSESPENSTHLKFYFNIELLCMKKDSDSIYNIL